MKKKRIVLICIFTLLFLGALIGLRVMSSHGVRMTENVADYHTKDYPLYSYVFMSELPECAEVVSFSYYNYWEEAKDYYLELKFTSQEEMNAYLNDLWSEAEASLQKDYQSTDRKWFISDQNPYDPSYTDFFCTYYRIITADTEYTGYSIEPSEDPYIPSYICNFGVISCSFEELTVIQTCVSGHFREGTHHHIPKYFQRFNLPLDEKHERRFYVTQTAE